MRIAGALLLFGLWLLLSASYEAAHVVAGAIAAFAVMWLNPVPRAWERNVSWLDGPALRAVAQSAGYSRAAFT